MIAGFFARLSWFFLAACGLAMLFAPDALLPRLVPGFPASGAWLGQLLAAAMLAIGVLNWLNQSALLGGVYGRHAVMPTAAFYFIAATSLLRQVLRGDTPALLWIVVVPTCIFAAVFCWLLFRGPLPRDFERYQRAASSQT